MVVGFAAGGAPDIIARLLAQPVFDRMGQPLVVDNRPGANYIIGTEVVSRAAGDGYTLLTTAGGHTINPVVYKKLPYDTFRDFTPISHICNSSGLVIVVHPSVPATSVRELVKLVQARPGQLAYGSGGNGTPAHICGEMFRALAKVNILHVPYKGTGQSVTDLMAGQIQLVFASMPVVFPHMKTGRLRTLAVTGAKRTPLAPNLPTVAESGIPGYAFDSWWGLVTNTGVPPAIVSQLNGEVRRIQQLPDVKERFADLGIDVLAGGPAELASFTRSEIDRFAKVIRDTGIRAE